MLTCRFGEEVLTAQWAPTCGVSQDTSSSRRVRCTVVYVVKTYLTAIIKWPHIELSKVPIDSDRLLSMFPSKLMSLFSLVASISYSLLLSSNF